MSKKRIIDFDDELTDVQQSIIEASNKLEGAKESSKETSDMLSALEDELKELGITTSEQPTKENNDSKNAYSDDYFLNLSEKLEKKLMKEINQGSNSLSITTKLDYIAAGLIGSIGAIVDMLMVRIPEQTNYLDKYMQEGSKMTEWLKSLGIDEDGKLSPFLAKLEKSSQVSYDASSKHHLNGYENDISGFYPKTHRLMSLGHDPFFGLIFGLLDILNGSITLIDSKGVIHQVKLAKFQSMNLKDKIFAPFLWFAHLLSDMCTKMGVPVPGWAFTQLLQFGQFGENDRTLADITRYMYIKGYDFRHFLTMSSVPATIELCTRVYHKLTVSEQNAYALTYERDLQDIQEKMRLDKMLFAAHSVAMGGNVLKVVLSHGNPLAFNVAQLFGFTKQSIEMVIMQARDKTAEKIVGNREEISERWDGLRDGEGK